MIIELKKFGTTLVSRIDGREAFLSLQRELKAIKKSEGIDIVFDGVLTLSPGWADEVLSPLLRVYGDRLIIKNSDNLSVLATLNMLQTITGKKFNVQ